MVVPIVYHQFPLSRLNFRHIDVPGLWPRKEDVRIITESEMEQLFVMAVDELG